MKIFVVLMMLVAWLVLYRAWNRGSAGAFNIGIFLVSGFAAFIGVGMVWLFLAEVVHLGGSSGNSGYPEDRYGR